MKDDITFEAWAKNNLNYRISYDDASKIYNKYKEEIWDILDTYTKTQTNYVSVIEFINDEAQASLDLNDPAVFETAMVASAQTILMRRKN